MLTPHNFPYFSICVEGVHQRGDREYCESLNAEVSSTFPQVPKAKQYEVLETAALG
ncbi:MAG: hypothetical protein F6K42_12935 [Leptolyngbya sp. SIO1D8]|nr:hypothetical protein [Leptolyngbya sp. SIO1D8]